MAYGILKCDTITFTDGGIDKSVAISGLVQNPTFTGNVTVTGTISGNTVQGQTVSGVTVTGTTAQFTSGTFVSLTGTTLQGTTATYTTGSFTSLTGTTTSGTTANFVSGVFSTQISGVTVTGTTANFTSGNFINISGGTHTITSGVFAAGTAANPSISFTSDPNTGIYSPGADQVAISTNGTGQLFVDSAGTIGIGAQGEASLSSDTKQIKVGGLSYFRGTNGTSGKQNFYCGISYNAAPTSSSGDKAIVSNASGDYLPAQYAMFQGTHVWRTAAAATAGSAITWNERMRLTNAGNLGLGTSSPDNKLSVGIASADEGIELKATYNGSRVARFGLLNPGVDNTPYIGSVTGNDFGFITSGTRRMTLDSTGRLGIGTTSPSVALEVNGAIKTTGANGYSDTDGTRTIFLGAGVTSGLPGLLTTTNHPLVFWTNGASNERMRIDTSGRLLVGTSTSAGDGLLQVRNDSGGVCYDAFRAVDTAAGAPVFRLNKSRGTAASPTEVSSGDVLGYIAFAGYDGAAFADAAYITAIADGTWTDGGDTTDNPGALVFSVTADGSASPTEALRISSNRAITISDGGNVVLGTTTGTKIGTATSQKIGFYNATPVVQPTTGVAEAAFVENSGGTAVNVDSTFGGYTIQQVVQALQTLGLLA